MASHGQKLDWWSEYRCDVNNLTALNLNGRYPVKVAKQAEAATLALEEAIMTVGYRSPMGPTGSYHCRYIGGTTTWSLHAFGIAIDWDYGANPHLREPIPRGFGLDDRFRLTEAHIDAVEAIRNDRGDQIWKWLGWTIGDTMHFEIDVPPDACQPATVSEGNDTIMDLATWAATLRPEDVDQLAAIGVITETERLYWRDLDRTLPEWQDFRNAYTVRLPLWR